MGLDAVELVMAYEEEFGLVIEDKHAEKMLTPRHVVDYIMMRINAARRIPCEWAQAFHRLRKALMERLNVTRPEVRPDAALATLIPLRGRRELWQRLSRILNVSLPELKRSHAIICAGAAVALVGFATCWYVLLAGAFSQQAFLAFSISFLVAALLAWSIGRSTRSLRLSFAPEVRTVREMVCFIVRQSGGIAPRRDWMREEVAAKVRAITIEILGIRATSYHEDARFVEDLGVS